MADVLRIVVAVLRQPVRNEAAVRFPCQAAHLGIVQAEHARTAFLHVGQELLEGLVDVLLCAVMVQMVIFDVRDDGNAGTELQEGAVAFVGLRHDPGAGAIPRVAAQGTHVAADDDGRVQPGFRRDDGNHGARRRFAVCAGDGHTLRLVIVQQFRQDIAAVQDRNAFGPCGLQFRIVRMDGAGNDDGVGAVDLRRVVPHEDHGPRCCELGRHMACVEVRTGHLEPALHQDISQSTHAGTTDTYKVDVLILFQHLKIPLPV